MSTNIRELYITETAVEDVPPSIRFCSRLKSLILSRSGQRKGLPQLPKSVTYLDVSYSDIERIPDCIKALHRLKFLLLSSCRRLTLLPELPGLLRYLMAEDCESLEIVFCPLNTPKARLSFINCFNMDQQARRAIIQQSCFLEEKLLPGRQVPEEFDHRAKGNSLTIRYNGNNPPFAFSRFKVCVVVSPHQQITESGPHQLLCCHTAEGELYPVEYLISIIDLLQFKTEHLYIFIIHSRLPFTDPSKVNREVVFEFSSNSHAFDIIECGVQILTDQWGYESGFYQELEEYIVFESSEASEDDTEYDDTTNGVMYYSKEDENLEGEKHKDCSSWLFFCFDLSHFMRNVGSLVSRRRQYNQELMKRPFSNP